jgi:hypothetical protein
MRRTLLTLTLAALALALVPGVATAKKTEDRVLGSGEALGGLVGFSFDNVRSDPFGGHPTGHVTITDAGQLFARADVECLNVVGNTATMSGTVRQSDLFETGGTLVVTAQDIGPSGQGDLLHAVHNPTGFDPTTACNILGTGLLPVTDGDIVVEDATCTPAGFKDKPGSDKDKCKDKP